jgi:hypothetical protein
MVKEKTYYDSDPEKTWLFRFDVLFIKRDHRRILNRQPEVKICYGCKLECVKMKNDFKVLSN